MNNKRLKIVFYCNDTLENIKSMEYYNQDIQALEKLGYDIKVCNSYKDIPLNFDIIYIWWWTYALYPVLLAKVLGKKSIVTGVFNYKPVDKLEKSGFTARPLYQRILIKLAVKLADINLFVSKMEFDEVPSVFKLRRYFYFPCAIADSYFANSENSARSGILNIAWSGKDNLRRKGVFDILGAMKILKDKGVLITCTLAGRQGDGYNDLVERIHQFELNEQITMLGEVSFNHKLDLFSQAKIYLQPSYFEGFGLATAEALAGGCCIIACDVGEVKNVLGSGAYYVTPGNQIELADAIEKILQDSQLRNKLVSEGRKRLSELYSQTKKKESLSEIISLLYV